MIITAHDSSEELRRLKMKALILHGDCDFSEYANMFLLSRTDQWILGMPASCSADLIKKLMPEGLCEVKMYEKSSHGM